MIDVAGFAILVVLAIGGVTATSGPEIGGVTAARRLPAWLYGVPFLGRWLAGRELRERRGRRR